MDNDKDTVCIWQWNCRGYAGKRALLQQYFGAITKKPQIIALQETLASAASLSGYRAVPGQSGGRGVCTVISKKLTHVAHNLQMARCNIEYVMVEILLHTSRCNQRKNGVFVLNVYSNPRHRRQPFKTLLERAVELAGPRPLVIVGDFNAPHDLWGYVYETRKGRNLWQDATELDFTLITDKAFPTRIGNSATRDTTPDLAFIKNVEKTTWANTAMDFGSDHYVLQTSIIVDRSRVREFMVVDWDIFRSIRSTRASAPDNF